MSPASDARDRGRRGEVPDEAILGDVSAASERRPHDAPLVRDAVMEDVPRLVQIARAAAMASGLELELRVAWAERMDAAAISPWVAQDAVRVVGAPDGFACRVGDLLHLLYVDPAWQGHGLGARLLRDAERGARNSGLASLRLATAQNAVGFYERRGWMRTGREVIDLGDVRVPRTWMVKPLR